MKSKKLVRVLSTVFIALFGIVTFIGGSGVSDAREVSEADFIAHVQCDDSVESAESLEADVIAEDALTVEEAPVDEAVDCDSQEELNSQEKGSRLSKARNRVKRFVMTGITGMTANGYSWNG